MVLVRAFNHRCLKGGLHVNATSAKRSDERLPHGIFVKVMDSRESQVTVNFQME
jgi:hypothetical protein